MLLSLHLQPLLQGPKLQLLQLTAGSRLAVPGQHCRGSADRAGGTITHQVAKFDALGLEVGGVVAAGIHHQRHPVFDLQAITTEACDFARVVGDQAQALDAQVAEDLSPHSVVAQIGSKAKAFIGFHRVEAGVLQGVGLELVDQANAPALLAQIHHHPNAGGFDHAQGSLQLGPAVAAQRTKGISCEALAVHPHQHRLLSQLRLALDDGHVLAAIEFVAVADGAEVAEGAGHGRFRLALHEALGIEAVADQFGNADQA